MMVNAAIEHRKESSMTNQKLADRCRYSNGKERYKDRGMGKNLHKNELV